VSRNSFISCLPLSVSIWMCRFVLCYVFSMCFNLHSSWICFICLPLLFFFPSFLPSLYLC
jgi:hypothetical protein